MADIIYNRNFPESIVACCLHAMNPSFDPEEETFVEDLEATEEELTLGSPLDVWEDLIDDLEFDGDFLVHETPIMTLALNRGVTIKKQAPACLEASMEDGDDGFRSWIKYYAFDFTTSPAVQNQILDLFDAKILAPVSELSELGVLFDKVVEGIPAAE
jgi:hypothetical protein